MGPTFGGPLCPRVQVMSMDGRYAGFAGAKTGHGPVALFGCFIFIFLPGMSSAAFGRRHINPIFAIWSKRAIIWSGLPSALAPARQSLVSELGELSQSIKVTGKSLAPKRPGRRPSEYK